MVDRVFPKGKRFNVVCERKKRQIARNLINVVTASDSERLM